MIIVNDCEEVEVSKDLELECDRMITDEDYCDWSGTLILDGFEYMGVEYFVWECPDCEAEHVLEDRLDE